METAERKPRGGNMDFREIPLQESKVYEGLIVNVRRDKAKLHDGTVVNREVVEHPGGVAVFAIDEEDRVVMVRQYRYAVGEEVLELPAGKLEPGEDPQLCAIRELSEETGVSPGEVHPLGYTYSSPGIFAEKVHLFFARNLSQGEASPDEGEFLDVVRIPLRKLLKMIEAHQIRDGKTVIGIMKGVLHLRGEGAV